MDHSAGKDHPRQEFDLGQVEVALDTELSVWASVGLTSVVVQQFCVSIMKPGDVNGQRAEAKDQAHEFVRALQQIGRWWAVHH